MVPSCSTSRRRQTAASWLPTRTPGRSMRYGTASHRRLPRSRFPTRARSRVVSTASRPSAGATSSQPPAAATSPRAPSSGGSRLETPGWWPISRHSRSRATRIPASVLRGRIRDARPSRHSVRGRSRTRTTSRHSPAARRSSPMRPATACCRLAPMAASRQSPCSPRRSWVVAARAIRPTG